MAPNVRSCVASAQVRPPSLETGAQLAQSHPTTATGGSLGRGTASESGGTSAFFVGLGLRFRSIRAAWH